MVGGSVNKGARPSLARMAHEADGMADGNLPERLFGEDEDEKAGDGLGLFKMPLLQTPAQAARTHSGVSHRVFDIRHTPRHISTLSQFHPVTQAGFQRFRERRRGQTRADDPIARCILGDPDPAAGTPGGNDLGFSLRETIFDEGDDAFGI